MNKIIVHADLNHCYAQIEEMKYPHLRGIPMAVGGSEKSRHGIILAKNDLAKKYKIKTGESLKEALKKCPNLLIINPNFDDYLYYTDKVKEIYKRYSDSVESFGLDEAWIDLSESQKLFGDGVLIAKKMQKEIFDELGLTVSMGLSYNKIFAKIGSDLDKNMGFTIIDKSNYKDVVWPLEIGELLYVGKRTKQKLNNLNIFTIGDLANKPIKFLKEKLGKNGEILWRFANGLDDNVVNKSYFKKEEKSIGNGITTKRDLYNFDDCKIVFYVLIDSIVARLKERKLLTTLVTINLRDRNLKTITRQKKIDYATDISDEIAKIVFELLIQNYDFKVPLRSVAVTVSGLKDKTFLNYQVNLLKDYKSRKKLSKIDEAVNDIRNRFGYKIIKRASLLMDEEITTFNPKDEHTIHPIAYINETL